jgi:hypothetical protein
MKKDRDTFINLFLGFGIYQFLLHSFFLVASRDPRALMPTVIAFTHDLFLLLLCCLIFSLINRLPPLSVKQAGEKILIFDT